MLCIPKTWDALSPPQIPKLQERILSLLSALWASGRVALAHFYAEGQLLGLLIPKPELFPCYLRAVVLSLRKSDASAPEILILTGLSLGLSIGLFKHPPGDSNVRPRLRTTG